MFGVPSSSPIAQLGTQFAIPNTVLALSHVFSLGFTYWYFNFIMYLLFFFLKTLPNINKSDFLREQERGKVYAPRSFYFTFFEVNKPIDV